MSKMTECKERSRKQYSAGAYITFGVIRFIGRRDADTGTAGMNERESAGRRVHIGYDSYMPD